MENIKKWLTDNNYNNYYGFNQGSGYGYGNGSGFFAGDGFGDGYGSGHCHRTSKGYGSGHCHGSGHGNGSGFGNGLGAGSGSRRGYGGCFDNNCDDGIDSYNGQKVYIIDGVQTLINHVHKTIAKGYILESDFSLIPCYIAKGNGYFAHGKTVKEAIKALQSKIFENMDSEETINLFIDKFEKDKKYPGTEFFEWHHYLTGSCLMGRESFVRRHELNLEDEITVDEFIALCENDYGSNIIKQLKDRWYNLKMENAE